MGGQDFSARPVFMWGWLFEREGFEDKGKERYTKSFRPEQQGFRVSEQPYQYRNESGIYTQCGGEPEQETGGQQEQCRQ